jgi:hypothetical protein
MFSKLASDRVVISARIEGKNRGTNPLFIYYYSKDASLLLRPDKFRCILQKKNNNSSRKIAKKNLKSQKKQEVQKL